jgi:hypothetical protein
MPSIAGTWSVLIDPGGDPGTSSVEPGSAEARGTENFLAVVQVKSPQSAETGTAPVRGVWKLDAENLDYAFGEPRGELLTRREGA